MRARTSEGDTNDFPVDIILHQASALSLFVLTIVLDKLTTKIQDEELWCMLFMEDIVLTDQTKDGVKTNLE